MIQAKVLITVFFYKMGKIIQNAECSPKESQNLSITVDIDNVSKPPSSLAYYS